MKNICWAPNLFLERKKLEQVFKIILWDKVISPRSFGSKLAEMGPQHRCFWPESSFSTFNAEGHWKILELVFTSISFPLFKISHQQAYFWSLKFYQWLILSTHWYDTLMPIKIITAIDGSIVMKPSTMNPSAMQQTQETWVQSLGLEDILWRRKWQPTPVFLPEWSHG